MLRAWLDLRVGLATSRGQTGRRTGYDSGVCPVCLRLVAKAEKKKYHAPSMGDNLIEIITHARGMVKWYYQSAPSFCAGFY